jgi:putative endonuclease
VTGLETGKRVESVALKYLRNAGLTLIKRNYRCRLGEIDLIMNDGDLLIFAEVRYRKSNRFGSGAESVDYRKRRKLILTARHFLASHHRYGEPDCRFDVISVSPSPSKAQSEDSDMRIEWFRDAFQADCD